MKLMNSLALRHLKQNKRQTLAALLAIILSVSMLVAVSTFCFSVYDATMEFAAAHDLGSAMGASPAGLVIIGVLLGLIICSAATFVISNAFSIQASERTKQFGILKSVGATDGQIMATVKAESNWLSLIGIPAGIILGHLLCFVAVSILNESVGGSGSGTMMSYTVRFNVIAIVLAAGLGYITIRMASSRVAGRVSKLSAIEAIRQTDEVYISSNALRTSRLTERIFGFEGVLASKQIKRNRRKFRVTVLSLVVSVVMLLCAFSFGDTLIRTARGAFADTGADVVLEAVGGSGDFSKFDEYAKMLKSQSPESMYTLYSYRYAPELSSEGWFNVITMDDDDYNEYCKQSGVASGANIFLKQSDTGQAVPFDISMPTLGGASFHVTAESGVTNIYMRSITMTYEQNIIVPRSELQKLGVPVESHYYITTGDAAAFIKGVEAQEAKFGFDHISHHNTAEYTRELQQLYAMLMMFVYCFIGMIALIGATSVLATINSNINLRRNEFATLQAVGMETKKLHKMLNFESILYGAQSLLIGLPIGLILSYGGYALAMNDTFRLAPGRMSPEEAAQFTYELPYIGILVCVIGVFAIGFVSMFFATGKIRRSNIAESMRELNC